MSSKNSKETPERLQILPYQDFDFWIKDDHTGYFGPFYGIAEYYAPKIARLELEQGEGLRGVWNKFRNPIETTFSSRDNRVQLLIDTNGLLGAQEIKILEEGVSNYYPEQAYLASFLHLLDKGQELQLAHAELLSMMSIIHAMGKT